MKSFEIERKLLSETGNSQKKQEKLLKKLIKKAYKQKMRKQIVSLLEKVRYNYKSYDDVYTEYGFLPKCINNDEDAEEYFREYYFLRNVFSNYDCTGAHFTLLYKLHRNPCGIYSFVHTIGIDV